ncbi:MAG: hypothetical protein HLUCCA11_08390 [Phormidesmis priestleyi Ana]|uniref:Uncharacterized protein n=1 Tax=Phormidesmis priestleyi Ana TaxID=1666911 RepID=A0A0P8C359_9CYAN|nr:MAG: hypothetical protein HLUCCA11_08390 [Phormidesmis priestleyi Ana]
MVWVMAPLHSLLLNFSLLVGQSKVFHFFQEEPIGAIAVLLAVTLIVPPIFERLKLVHRLAEAIHAKITLLHILSRADHVGARRITFGLGRN